MTLIQICTIKLRGTANSQSFDGLLHIYILIRAALNLYEVVSNPNYPSVIRRERQIPG